MSARVVPSGECLRDEGLVWLITAVVCSLAIQESLALAVSFKHTVSYFIFIVKYVFVLIDTYSTLIVVCGDDFSCVVPNSYTFIKH